MSRSRSPRSRRGGSFTNRGTEGIAAEDAVRAGEGFHQEIEVGDAPLNERHPGYDGGFEADEPDIEEFDINTVFSIIMDVQYLGYQICDVQFEDAIRRLDELIKNSFIMERMDDEENLVIIHLLEALKMLHSFVERHGQDLFLRTDITVQGFAWELLKHQNVLLGTIGLYRLYYREKEEGSEKPVYEQVLDEKVIIDAEENNLLSVYIEVIPKPCYREGVSPSRTLPRVAISSGKPFHLPGSGCGLDGGYPGIRGSDQGIPGVRRSFWDDLIVNPDYYTVFSDLINEVLSCIRDWRWTNAGFVVVDFDSAQVRRL